MIDAENRWMPPSPHRERILEALQSGAAHLVDQGHRLPPLLVFEDGGMIPLPRVRDLVETRVSGGEAVLLVPSGDITAFADAVERLLDDPDLRVELGLRARHRVASELDWRPQARAYIGVYDELLGGSGTVGADDAPFTEPPAGVDKAGRPYVDLRDDAELRHFIASRGRGAQPGE